MAFKHLIVAALALKMVFSHPADLGRDQYEHSQNFKTTDPGLHVGQSQQRTHRSVIARRFQQGRRQQASSLETLETFPFYRSSQHQINMPYYIPVHHVYYMPIFRGSGKICLFFPQLHYFNPGFPLDNPSRRPQFVGPSYLPPVTEKPGRNDTVLVVNRFDDDDDGPVWGGNDVATASPNDVIPTRPPPPPMSDYPPLIHDNDGSRSLSASNSFVPFPQDFRRAFI